MNSRDLCLISLLLALASCGGGEDGSAQENDTTKSTNIPVGINSTERNTITSFIPQGFEFHDSTGGDLDLDAYRDIALVVRVPGEDTISRNADTQLVRPLILLSGQPDGSYKLAGRCDKAVYCFSCGGMMGDPYMDIVIKNGYFSVEHYGGSAWRWERIITFRYSPADSSWFLHKEGQVSFHAGDPDESRKEEVYTTKDFGKIRFEDYDIYGR